MTVDAAEGVNRVLAEEVPALAAALSPLGLRAVFPPDIPAQAAEARGRAFNATIGQIADGRGKPLVLPSVAAALDGLPEDRRDRALLYSPVEGIPEVRRAWRVWQRRGVAADVLSSLPLAVDGLTHGLSLVADLFAGPGRRVLVLAPFWGNYRQAFALRTGARMEPVPAYRDGRFDEAALGEALARLQADDPAVVILNFPSNPGGYMPTRAEREILRAGVVAAAERRPLVVVCDDAYAGLVYDDAVPAGSLFWELAGAHPNLVPVKVDGATKELALFGARVGFVTFAVEPDSTAAQALESKLKCLARAAVGSPVALGQILVLAALESPAIEEEIAGLHAELARRWQVLTEALAGLDPALLRPLPCNAGCFALLELPEPLGLDAETVRRHLLEHEDTGVIAVAPRYLRLAFCSVDADRLPELVQRLERGVRRLAARRV
ncbi:MAG: aminotransferase class I/II-fold pyridoxal phosphate-dependent enzyme [Thermoanaerobaculia bacterium]